MAAVSSMLATRRLLANICCFDQNYQIGKITLQVLIQMIEYLFAAPLIMDAVIFALLLPLICCFNRNRDRGKWYAGMVKGLII